MTLEACEDEYPPSERCLAFCEVFDDLRAARVTPFQAMERLTTLYADDPERWPFFRELVEDETPEVTPEEIAAGETGVCARCSRDMALGDTGRPRRFCRRSSCQRARRDGARQVKGAR